MKTILLAISVFLISFSLPGKQVETERARKVAAAFLSTNNSGLKSISVDDLVSIPIIHPANNKFTKLKSKQPGNEQLLYLFKENSGGFVLVAGDDLARPILAYSISEKIDNENLPVNFLKWTEEYKKQIRHLREIPEYKSAKANNIWQQLEQGQQIEKASPDAVSPLMTTKWDQSPYYNDLCPQLNWYSQKAVTGCVATAMAQIMKYHNYPAQGSGIRTYYHTSNTVTYGTLSANFGATMYDWGNMPNALSSSSTQVQVNAVATLMLHCGIAVDMDYSPAVSGAWVTEEKSQNGASSELAFKEFFGYNGATVKGIQREGKTTIEWLNLIKSELDSNRPVLFAGVGDGGGHAFVADGYDNNNFFHINWGWGGIADGYYATDAFNPYDLGTGAGGGSYNWYQRIVAGIQPPEQVTEQSMYLYSDISVPEIYQFIEFNIEHKIYNLGPDFYGDLGAALFDKNGDFVEFIDKGSLAGNPLLSRKIYNITFESEGLSVYPGTYYIGIYYMPVGDNWIALPEVPDGGVSNFIEVEIISPFTDSDIKLYDSIRVTPLNPVSGEAISVTADIGNFSYSDYTGEFGAGLFTRQGDVVQTIDVIDEPGLEKWTFDTYTFSNNKLDAPPGTYLIGLVHFPNGGDDQYVVAPFDYINPVQVNVKNSPLLPDSFEDNNTVSTAYGFNVEFEDDYSGFYTIGTNMHNESDEDYYYIDLPSGYTYTITASAHDAYWSELGDDFTLDVIWAHSINDEWSDLYDDEMDKPYMLYNGGRVYFGILPYFEGQTGSYSFLIRIGRDFYTGNENNTSMNNIEIYPNPVSDILQISYNETIKEYKITDNTGRIVLAEKAGKMQHTAHLNKLKPGVYIISIYGETGIETRKFIKR
jgi:hypothetical protein